MIPIPLKTNFVFIITFITTPPIDINGVHEHIFGYVLYTNNIIFDAIIPIFATINFHFYPIGEVSCVDE